jgi:predicted ATP-grasp superfamily ATP-dependent carboligase
VVSYVRSDMVVPRRPLLVMVLEGWIDAGFGAATALAALTESISTEPVITFDPDDLIDFRARRPRVQVVDGLNAGVTWQQPEMRLGEDKAGTAVLFLAGPEPDFHWRSFADTVSTIALELDVRMAIGLGAFPAAVPHTRPIRMASTASDSELAEKVGFVTGSLEVPAGVQAVLERSISAAGIPTVGLWARVPHYLAGTPFPPAALALVETLADVGGLVLETGPLRQAAEAGRQRVDELIRESDDHKAMVRTLEERIDEAEGTSLGRLEDSGGRLPSGEELAAELERYLRGDGTPGPDEAG